MQLTYADMAAAECVRRLRDRADLEFALLHTGTRRLEEDREDREGEKFQDAYPCLWSLQEWVFSSVEGVRKWRSGLRPPEAGIRPRSERLVRGWVRKSAPEKLVQRGS